VRHRTSIFLYSVALATFAIVALVIIRNAWVSDDAHITFRTIAQAIQRNGLVWNLGTRVQAYTHPLWMALQIPFHLAGISAQLTVIGLGIALTLGAFLLMIRRFYRTPVVLVIATVSIIFSKAIIDFATSGLENSLSYLLFTLLLFWVYRGTDTGYRRIIAVFLLSAIGLTRTDLLAICLPVLIVIFYRVPWMQAVRELLIGLSPLLLWHVWSLLYYGITVPNTAIAKLAANLPLQWYLERAYHYWEYQIRYDPFTLFITAIGIGFAWVSRQKVLISFSSGIIVYLIYVTSIGGDFMLGRFFATPAWIALMLLCISIKELGGRMFSGKLPLIVLASIVSAAALLSPRNPVFYPLTNPNPGDLTELRNPKHIIVDEGRFYCPNWCLGQINNPYQAPYERDAVPVIGMIGAYGYYAPLDYPIIDGLGLADPLTARLAARTDIESGIGHIHRAIPNGYPEYIRTGDLSQITDETVRSYQAILNTVTRENLFSLDRYIAIAYLNIYAPTLLDYATPKIHWVSTLSLFLLIQVSLLSCLAVVTALKRKIHSIIERR
jgi:arabinofuranosyltransferase